MGSMRVEGINTKVIRDFEMYVAKRYSGTDVDFVVELENAMREYMERHSPADTLAHAEDKGGKGE